ncbi:MAG: hypothetical protein LIO77_00590, partial [Rikenellaceae bacterium]|nr:hypothetical protein [Rikenellaceae bacterium]
EKISYVLLRSFGGTPEGHWPSAPGLNSISGGAGTDERTRARGLAREAERGGGRQSQPTNEAGGETAHRLDPARRRKTEGHQSRRF